MKNEAQTACPHREIDLGPEMEEWFSVSGDMDDFIYYGDPAKDHSEK